MGQRHATLLQLPSHQFSKVRKKDVTDILQVRAQRWRGFPRSHSSRSQRLRYVVGPRRWEV